MQFRSISSSDAIVLLEIINDSLTCDSEIRLCDLMTRLGELLPYRAAVSCISKSGIFGSTEGLQVLNLNYPIDHFADLIDAESIWKDPIVMDHLKYGSFKLHCWADIVKQLVSSETVELISRKANPRLNRVNAYCGYSYAIVNHKQTEGSLFAWYDLQRCRRTEDILNLIAPHFHAASRRINSAPTDVTSLTRKETEVLNWVKEGKKTWDISTILGISERTVKFHISNIMQKLDASSRAHAVAKAIEQGLLHLE